MKNTKSFEYWRAELEKRGLNYGNSPKTVTSMIKRIKWFDSLVVPISMTGRKLELRFKDIVDIDDFTIPFNSSQIPFSSDIDFIFWESHPTDDSFLNHKGIWLLFCKLNDGTFLYFKAIGEPVGYFYDYIFEYIDIKIYDDPLMLVEAMDDEDYQLYMSETDEFNWRHQHDLIKCENMLSTCVQGRRNLFIDVDTGKDVFNDLLGKKISVQRPIDVLQYARCKNIKNQISGLDGKPNDDFTIDWGIHGLWFANGLTYMLPLGKNFPIYLFPRLKRTYIYELIPNNESIYIEGIDPTKSIKEVLMKYDGAESNGITSVGVFWRLQKGFSLRLLYVSVKQKVYDKDRDLFKFYLNKPDGLTYGRGKSKVNTFLELH